MRVALAQLNYFIGDFDGNLKKILDAAGQARSRGCDLLLFSELSVCGYPPLDLLEREEFITACTDTVEKIATSVDPDMGLLVGAPEFNPEKEGKLLYNAVYFLHGGNVKQIFRKTLLPTYDIFDEYRYFEPNKEFRLLKFKGYKFAVTICEDLWDQQPFESSFSRSRLYKANPMEELSRLGPDAILNLAASPFAHQKLEVKQSIFTEKARRYGIPVIYCNQVGAQTELIFEGGSLAIQSDGGVMKRLRFFSEDFEVFDFDDLLQGNTGSQVGKIPDRITMVAEALVCGIRDYFSKMKFSTATLGLSGGIDSAVTLALAAEALGPDRIRVLLMPSQYSSSHSVEDSVRLADNLGVKYDILHIEQVFRSFRTTLEPLFKDLPEDIAEENIQARIRSILLMALSNKFGNILLNTSNKSETAVGYGTLYGDMSGGLSVLGDVYKGDVYLLARHINKNGEVIPENIIRKPPSAELRPDQLDTDSLPPYEELDTILEAYIEKQIPLKKLTGMGYDKSLVERIIRMVDQNEYKRYQTPPILRISSKAFGVGRRLPLVARY